MGTAQPPGDDPGEEDLVLAWLFPHERSPAVSLAGVLALDATSTEHVLRDGVGRQGLGTGGGRDHRDGHLLESGGEDPALSGHPPPGHRQRVADLHARPRQADGAEMLQVRCSLQPPHGDVVVLVELVVLRVFVHALHLMNSHHRVALDRPNTNIRGHYEPLLSPVPLPEDDSVLVWVAPQVAVTGCHYPELADQCCPAERFHITGNDVIARFSGKLLVSSPQ